jgi:hypothetical protein
MTRLLALASLALAVTACGGFEGTLTQKLSVKNGDTTGTSIASEHELDADSSNWGAYFADAKKDLGQDPTSISFTSASIQLDTAKAKNIGKLEDAIKGDVVLFVKIKDTNAIIDIATVTDPKGTGLVEFSMTGGDVTAQKDALVKGNFRIGIRGTAVKAATDDFEAPLSVTLGVEAK